MLTSGSLTGLSFNFGTQGGTLATGLGFGCTSAPTVTFAAAPAGGTTATATVTVGQMQGPPPLVIGVPHRLTPDVSLNAASGHDATFFCSEGVCELNSSGHLVDAGLVGGTSVAAPAWRAFRPLSTRSMADAKVCQDTSTTLWPPLRTPPTATPRLRRPRLQLRVPGRHDWATTSSAAYRLQLVQPR